MSSTLSATRPLTSPSAASPAPAALVMVRPHRFRPNPETAADNGFQQPPTSEPELQATNAAQALAASAHAEHSRAVEALRAAGLRVHLFEDLGERDTPDSVFPNNWFSSHADGTLMLYPMHAPNRRRERREDILALLQREYRVRRVIDHSGLATQGVALEGTGAMVLDAAQRLAFLARSQRTHEGLLATVCAQLGYRAQVFDALDVKGLPVYHSNVLLCVARRFALVGLSLVKDAAQRERLRASLAGSGLQQRTVIELSPEQIGEFAGNALELRNAEGGHLLALSSRAEASLSAAQKAQIRASATLLPLAVPTIEQAGGSVRCMLAGIHLERRAEAEGID